MSFPFLNSTNVKTTKGNCNENFYRWVSESLTCLRKKCRYSFSINCYDWIENWLCKLKRYLLSYFVFVTQASNNSSQTRCQFNCKLLLCPIKSHFFLNSYFYSINLWIRVVHLELQLNMLCYSFLLFPFIAESRFKRKCIHRLS